MGTDEGELAPKCDVDVVPEDGFETRELGQRFVEASIRSVCWLSSSPTMNLGETPVCSTTPSSVMVEKMYATPPPTWCSPISSTINRSLSTPVWNETTAVSSWSGSSCWATSLTPIGTDGYGSFYSRTDDVIACAGYRIGLAEIEESLAAHEAVTNAGVIGVPADTQDEIPKAFVMLALEVTLSNELAVTLQEHMKSRLAKHGYPREHEFVDELPLTTTGKVWRHDLRKQEGLVR